MKNWLRVVIEAALGSAIFEMILRVTEIAPRKIVSVDFRDTFRLGFEILECMRLDVPLLELLLDEIAVGFAAVGTILEKSVGKRNANFCDATL